MPHVGFGLIRMDESDDEGGLRDGYLLLVDGGQASDVPSRVTAPLQGLISATRAREPVADRDLSEEDAGAECGADGVGMRP